MADHCFAPLINKNARLLILGSYPGISSLEKQEYYAHPTNVFWRIMSEIIGFDRYSDYPKKTDALSNAGVALWDVMYNCSRQGSLDSAIKSSTIQLNNFDRFFHNHRDIKAVFFNGKRAEKEFKKRDSWKLYNKERVIDLHGLPSTSPALATMNFEMKLRAWRAIEVYL